MNVYDELTEKITLLSINELDYLFKDTIFIFKKKIYEWNNHSRLVPEKYYMYSYLKCISSIWYPYSMFTVLHILPHTIYFDPDITIFPIINNLSNFLNDNFQIINNTTWEERLECVLYQLI